MDSIARTHPKRPRRHFRKWVLMGAAVLLLAGTAILARPFIDQARTIWSLQKLDGYPLYAMTYYGDYRLDYTVDNPKLRSQGGGVLCSSFLCRNEKGEPLFCRNLDYALAGHPIVMTQTRAPEKNATLAICDLYYLGYSVSRLPAGSLFADRALLNAPRVPMDGVNEYGVALAGLSVPHAEPPLDPAKETIDEASALRLALDNAKTVQEAVDVITGYNMLFHEGAAHFMIADGNGDSAVLEYVKGEAVAVRSDTPWQAVTNFILSSPAREGVGQDRYDRAEAALAKANGILSEEEAMALLGRVSQPGTLWSVIYNLKTGETRLALRMKYDKLYSFKLTMR